MPSLLPALIDFLGGRYDPSVSMDADLQSMRKKICNIKAQSHALDNDLFVISFYLFSIQHVPEFELLCPFLPY